MYQCKEDNRVIIRVWTSKLNKGRNVGHISIEIPSIKITDLKTREVNSFYVSLWPKDLPEEVLEILRNATTVYAPEFKKNADADMDDEAEERLPEKIVCLYSLDITAIHKRFEKIKTELKGWRLIGHNKFLSPSTHSCASIAYELLKAGGIYDLISSAYASHPSLSASATPDELAAIAVVAKQKELERYPVSRNFVFTRESSKGTERETSVVQSRCADLYKFFKAHPYVAATATVAAAATFFMACTYK